MTTMPDVTSPAEQDFRSSVEVGDVTWRRVAASEWVKLRSLRSSWLTMGIAVAALVGIAVVGGILTNQDWSHMRPQRRANFQPIDASLTGVAFAQLAIGVLGVLFISGEYGTGMIRSTLGAVPRRLPVLWAKLAVFGAVSLVLMEISAFLAFFLGQAALGSHGTSISAPGALRAVIGTGLYLTGVGLLGVALGFLIRITAGGIAALVGLLLLLPGIMNILPQSWQDTVTPYLPSSAGGAVYQIRVDPGTLTPWTGFGVFCLYVVVAIVVAAFFLRRRDA
jgi:ABC-2 type transport system permease protein